MSVDADGKPKHHVLMGEHAKQRAEAFEKERIITKVGIAGRQAVALWP